jgi:adenylate kinase family enzyme
VESSEAIARLATSKRILVLGSSGSGKSSLTRQLCQVLDIEPIHLDAHFWKPGWVSTPQPEWRQTVASLISRDSWIMDGTYESTLDLRIPAADTLIVLERSRLLCLWRCVKRKATIGDRQRPDAPPGQKLDLAFLRYIWHYPEVTRPFLYECIRQHGENKLLIVLRGQKEVARLLQQVEKR